MDFAGKAVIVTGSSAGIGRATALAFAKQGASVTIHGQSEQKLEATKALLVKEAGLKEKQIVVVAGPIQEERTAKELVDKTVKAFGKIDILVNNAGIMQAPGEQDSLSLDNFDYVFDVNVRSVIQLTRLATPHLAKTKGTVVNVSSVISTQPVKAHMYYAMSKAALDHYTLDAANLLGQEYGIRVNGVNPGMIHTDFLPRHGIDYKPFDEMVTPNTIAKRVGTSEEMADVITFLAGPRSSYVWGANIVAGGGGGNVFAKF